MNAVLACLPLAIALLDLGCLLTEGLEILQTLALVPPVGFSGCQIETRQLVLQQLALVGDGLDSL